MKALRTVVLSTLILVMILTPYAAPALASVTGTTGDVAEIPVPSSVVRGALESDNLIYLFTEREDSILPTDLTVNISQPGDVTTTDDFTPSTLTASTAVDSYLLHFDPLGSDTTPHSV